MDKVKLLFNKKEVDEIILENLIIGAFIGFVIGHFVTVLMIIYADPVGGFYEFK